MSNNHSQNADGVNLTFSEPERVTVKSPATIRGQLAKLSERGMIVDDAEKAYATLERINYYRLAHYFAVFLDETGKRYKEGTRFNDGIRIYKFDRKLRKELIAALEEVEISVRAAVSNYHSVRYGALGYINGDFFDRRHNHRAFLSKIEHLKDKNSDLSFVLHHNQKYGGALPLWVMLEMFSFGALLFFYQDLKLEDKKEIAKYYYNLDCRDFENWVENLVFLRNHCSHYNRVYGNILNDGFRAFPPFHREYQNGSSLFDYLLAIKFLHKNSERWRHEFVGFMQALFDEYKDVVNPEILGFPEDWISFFE